MMPDELRDPQIGISLRFIRQWDRPRLDEITAWDVEVVRWWYEWRRWQAGLTDADRAWLLEGGISPL